MRLRFLRWLRKLTGTPQNCWAPKWILVLHSILFPLHSFYEKQSGIKYDPRTNIYTIRGMKFSAEIFDSLKDSSLKGEYFQLVDVGECATIRRVKIHINGADLKRALT